MRVLSCKNVSREIDELERGQEPDVTVQSHLQSCGACRTFYDDRLKLQQMIGDLETVEAPGDFDFRLRARLASQRGESHSRFGIGNLEFGLPTVALAAIALLVGVGLYMRMTTDAVIQPQLAQTKTQPARSATAEPIQATSGSEAKEAVEGTVSAAAMPVNKAGQVPVANDRIPNRRSNKNLNSNMIRRDEFVARSEDSAMFPIEAAEPLRLSVDDRSGTSRTISVPAVSFGSQQVVARGASMVKTSARTVW